MRCVVWGLAVVGALPAAYGERLGGSRGPGAVPALWDWLLAALFVVCVAIFFVWLSRRRNGDSRRHLPGSRS